MHDEHDAGAFDVRGGIGDAGTAGRAAAGAEAEATGRVQRAVNQAQDAATQLGELVRARPLASAVLALGVGCLVGRKR